MAWFVWSGIHKGIHIHIFCCWQTHASGAIFVSSKVTAGVTLPDQTEHVVPPPPHPRHHPRQHRRQPGPSRLRRCEQHAQSRELAAAQVVPKTPNKSEAAYRLLPRPLPDVTQL
jgi:hypothetical protein